MNHREWTYFWYRAKRRLFSRQSWVVLHRSLVDEGQTDTILNPDYAVVKADAGDCDAILNALPQELAGHLPPRYRRQLVYGRLSAGIPCFVVKDAKGVVAGGCWCSPFSHVEQLEQLDLQIGKAFEIITLFVDPAYRGQSIATILLDHVCKAMGRSGYRSCVSLVWYSREASIRAHLKSGFEPVGEKNTYSLFGVRWTRFNGKVRLP